MINAIIFSHFFRFHASASCRIHRMVHSWTISGHCNQLAIVASLPVLDTSVTRPLHR